MKLFLGLNGEIPMEETLSSFDGVGIIRSEYLCRQIDSWITTEEAQHSISVYVECIAKMFAPRPVWYRFTDMESNEVNMLNGCDEVILEKTTMLGLRGLRRSLRVPGALEAEASLVSRLGQAYTNLNVLLPYVGDATEVEPALNMLSRSGFRNRVGIMAEIPSAVLTLGDILSLGIDFVTVGMNDLTSLTLGAYRGSFFERSDHPAVLALVERCLQTSASAGAEVLIGGYLTTCLINKFQILGADNFIVYYSKLNELWPERYGNLVGAIDLTKVKNRVRAKCNDPLLPNREEQP